MLKSQFMNKSNSMKSQFTNKSQYMSKSQFINKNNNISLAQRFMKLNLFISLLQDTISKKLQKWVNLLLDQHGTNQSRLLLSLRNQDFHQENK